MLFLLLLLNVLNLIGGGNENSDRFVDNGHRIPREHNTDRERKKERDTSAVDEK